MDITDKTIPLHDGRILGYTEYGNLEGKALFYFHGHPGSRLEARFWATQAEQMGIRLIGVDRPGMGLSSYKIGRRFLDWPVDVVQLADTLQIDRFSVAGFSGGSPYALSCAYRIPNRLLACGVVSGVGDVSLFLAFLSQWLPWLVLPLTRRFFQDQERAEKTLARFAERWGEPDRKSFQQPGIKELMAASLVEATRQGAKGAAYDGTLLGHSWGFNRKEITLPAVYLWHGELDTSIPVATAREVAASIPQCKAMYYPNEGHISLIVNHAQEILSKLTA
ncbi:MAG: alpha/beta hydrolase [Chloroflexota bacterium]